MRGRKDPITGSSTSCCALEFFIPCYFSLPSECSLVSPTIQVDTHFHTHSCSHTDSHLLSHPHTHTHTHSYPYMHTSCSHPYKHILTHMLMFTYFTPFMLTHPLTLMLTHPLKFLYTLIYIPLCQTTVVCPIVLSQHAKG